MLEDKNAGALMAAISDLAKKVQPVTVASLRSGQNDAHWFIRKYELSTMVLAAIIIPLSMFSFVGIGISNTILPVRSFSGGFVRIKSEPGWLADKK